MLYKLYDSFAWNHKVMNDFNLLAFVPFKESLKRASDQYST